MDVDLTDGQEHDLELYLLDWDSTDRKEQVQISTPATGTVLSTQSVDVPLRRVPGLRVSGNILITFTNQAGENAVLSGLFLDPAQPTVTSETPSSGAAASRRIVR